MSEEISKTSRSLGVVDYHDGVLASRDGCDKDTSVTADCEGDQMTIAFGHVDGFGGRSCAESLRKVPLSKWHAVIGVLIGLG